jgi:hypothetical protein
VPLSTRALQQGLHQEEKGTFADQLAQLDNWLSLTESPLRWAANTKFQSRRAASSALSRLAPSRNPSARHQEEKGTFADQLAQLDNWLSLTEPGGEESLRATH